jgi:flagellar hook-associated protein 2
MASTINSTGTLASPGVGSGLDVNGIVTKLMAVESQPLNALATKQASYQAKLSAFGSLQGSVDALQTAVKGLTSASAYTGYSASSSDSTVLTATASSTATAGSYDISVITLAKANTIRSNTAYALTDTFNSGTLAITVGSTTTNVTIDATNNSLTGIAKAINDAGAPVTASVINDGTSNRLVLTAKSTGASNAINIVATEDGTTTGNQALTAFSTPADYTSNTHSMYLVQASVDASFSVNGLALTRSSNIVSDVVNGVTITLQKDGGATSALKVARNGSSVTGPLNSFISSYNALIKSIQTLTSYNSATKQGGALLGNFGVENLQAQLPSLIFASVSGLSGGISSLNDIGVSVQKDGTLALDSTKLSAALSDPTKDVAALMTQTTLGNQGIAVRFNTILTQALGATGLFKSSTEGINASIKDISAQQESWSTRLTKIEANYRAQFSALDTLVASMQTTQSYLTQQLTSLASLANYTLK